jgi:hypothetical protein
MCQYGPAAVTAGLFLSQTLYSPKFGRTRIDE